MKKNTQLKLLLIASYINNLGWGIYSPLYAVYVLHLGGTNFQISTIWSMYALIAGALMMFFGRLENSKTYNPSLMLAIGYGLFILVAFAYLSAKNVHQIYLAQALLAIAMGIMTPAARITYARAQKKGKEAGEWGLFDGGNYILISVAAFVGGLLFKVGGFHAIFISMIAIQSLAALLALQYNFMRK